jgi:hypothetical protein
MGSRSPVRTLHPLTPTREVSPVPNLVDFVHLLVHSSAAFCSLVFMSSRSKHHTDLPAPFLAVDDPRKVVKVVASDGRTGEQKDLSYTNCKVIGNGSFGIVFQARLLDEPGNADIAIKKVLQDKRFKVCALLIAGDRHVPCSSRRRTVNCKSCVS